MIGDHVSVADLDPAVPVTVPHFATHVLLQAITADVRFTLDGTTPTASVGFLLVATQEPTAMPVEIGNILTFFSATGALQYQFIQVRR